MDARVVVTAAEFTRQFGQLRQERGDGPVFVTHHGRETHVLLTRRRYDELTAPAAPGPTSQDDPLHQLAEWLPHAVLVATRDGAVRFANPAAHTMMQVPIGELVDRPLAQAAPAIAGSLIESYLRRTLRSGEAAAADLPSPFRRQAWLQVEMRPSGSDVTILMRDVTDDVLRHRLADRNRTVADAVRMHVGIGQVVLNVRGYIEAVDETVSGWLALPPERLLNVPMADLIPSKGRVAFREQLDAVLRGGGPATTGMTLVANTGDALALAATVIELRGLYGSEGAILVLTRT